MDEMAVVVLIKAVGYGLMAASGIFAGASILRMGVKPGEKGNLFVYMVAFGALFIIISAATLGVTSEEVVSKWWVALLSFLVGLWVVRKMLNFLFSPLQHH